MTGTQLNSVEVPDSIFLATNRFAGEFGPPTMVWFQDFGATERAYTVPLGYQWIDSNFNPAVDYTRGATGTDYDFQFLTTGSFGYATSTWATCNAYFGANKYSCNGMS